ncbi:hypothetical protein B0H67DRAFT_640284 [Lasiosphaeris hirsuta]|uniref:Uncharacterized protein n=1 Tax=Lasiosphaeris hirsuta TaxID=260670 RepID=A0AA40BCZ9_9PEZI|nr:hypothetical protein B0H67DRAFT_640284 [Lasiosphaeris hirsuta]
MLKEVAKNSSYGERLLKLLFDRYGRDLMIAGRVVEVTAADGTAEMMELLLDQYQYPAEVGITEPVVVAAAGNLSLGDDMPEFLLGCWGGEVKDTEEAITEDAIVAAVEHEYDACDSMELLLARRGAELAITRKIAKAAVLRNESLTARELVEMFLLHWGDEWT